MNDKVNNQRGYTLIISVVVISTILLMIATVSARRVQDAFFASIDLSQSIRAQALAEGCAEIALLKFARNSAYAGDETIYIGNDTCSILSVSNNLIRIQAVSQLRYYHLRIEVSSEHPPAIVNWQRVASF